MEINFLKDKRVSFWALGCRTNLYEAEALAGQFEAVGAKVFQGVNPADVAVVVTCSVTAVADRKCRKLIRGIRGKNPDAVVVACGCWAQKTDDVQARELGVDVLVGNRHKGEVLSLVERVLARRAGERDLEQDWEISCEDGILSIKSDVLHSDLWDNLCMHMKPRFHRRAFLKVQDGCDHRCTYCIIPFLRGRSVSKPVGEVLDEARAILDAGCREIVVTGVHLGLYGRDIDSGLTVLVEGLRKLEGLERLRFGSLEPFSVEDGLLEVLAETSQFCRHFHLPLQSGDDEVLRRMGRGHSSADYLRLVERLRGFLGDDLHVSTDVMTGFPGETGSAFSNTLRVLEEAGIGKVHAFSYSPREGTPAVSFGDKVPQWMADLRTAELVRKGDELAGSYGARWVGREILVLVETLEDGFYRGHADCFLECVFPVSAKKVEIGDVIEVKVASCNKGELFGYNCSL